MTKITKRKMSAVEVVQRVLQSWAPIGYSYNDWLYAGIPTFNEYDSYAFDILDMLRGSCSEETLARHLDDIALNKMGLKGGKKEGEAVQNNRAFAAILRAVWRNHEKPDSNLRLDADGSSFAKDGDTYRTMTDLEIVERALEELDAKKIVYIWLLGGDDLKCYDEVAVDVLGLLERRADRESLTRELLLRFECGDSKEAAKKFLFFADALLQRWTELKNRPEWRQRRNVPRLKAINRQS